MASRGRSAAETRWLCLAALIATLIHLEKFNGGDGTTIAISSFYAWVIV